MALLGADGVGKAIAFGLLKLGAGEIRIVDRDQVKVQNLAVQLRQVNPDIAVHVSLFFHQGLAAFRIFCGQAPDPRALRDALAKAAQDL